MRAHLQENPHLYGGQTLVNLVNHKGHEKPVKEAFEKYTNEKLDRVSTPAFVPTHTST